MSEVPGEQVRCPNTNRHEQYGLAFVGQRYSREERVIRSGSGGNDLGGTEQLLQLSPLLRMAQVSAGLFGRLDRGERPCSG